MSSPAWFLYAVLGCGGGGGGRQGGGSGSADVDVEAAWAECESGECPAWVTTAVEEAEAAADPYLVEYLTEVEQLPEATAEALLWDPAWLEFEISLIDRLLASDTFADESSPAKAEQESEEDQANNQKVEETLEWFMSGEGHPLNFADDVMAAVKAAQLWAAEKDKSVREGLQSLRDSLATRLAAVRADAANGLAPIRRYVKAELAFERCLVFSPTRGTWELSVSTVTDGTTWEVEVYAYISSTDTGIELETTAESSGGNNMFNGNNQDCYLRDHIIDCPDWYGYGRNFTQEGAFSSEERGESTVFDEWSDQPTTYTVELITQDDSRACKN